MHFAINKGDLDEVKLQIEKGLDLNFIHFGNTPLTLSIQKENFDIAFLLIKSGANLLLPEKTKWSRLPIHLAVCCGNRTLVEELVKRCPACVHSTDGMLFTPLHWAATLGNLAIAEYLIENGSHINVPDDRRRTPLHRASENEHFHIVELLLREYANVNSSDQFGWTPIYQNIVCQHVQMVEYLIRSGAHLNVFDNLNQTPLHVACSNNSTSNLHILGQTSTNLNTRHLRTATPALLHAVSADDYLPLVRLLLDFGASVNVLDSKGRTPLRVSAEFGHKEIIPLLIDSGTNLNLEEWIENKEWPAAISDDIDFCHWLSSFETNTPPSLMHLCKWKIRTYLGQQIDMKITQLPLPSKLKLFLSLQNIPS